MLKKSASAQTVARKRKTCVKGATWTDWIFTSSRPSRQSRVLLSQTCRPSTFCCTEMVVPNRARENIVAGYCEAVPILVQQRPCAYMMLTVGVHFS